MTSLQSMQGPQDGCYGTVGSQDVLHDTSCMTQLHMSPVTLSELPRRFPSVIEFVILYLLRVWDTLPDYVSETIV